MTREELRTFIKTKFKDLGFQSRKSYFYKVIDNDYLIAFWLEPSSNSKGYTFNCGIVYLPDEKKMPFHGLCDRHWYFWFPWEPEVPLDLSQYPSTHGLRYVFEYEKYTVDQLEDLFSINYEFFMVPLWDKTYGLKIFYEDWRYMNRFSSQNIDKLCRRMGIDTLEVLTFLGRVADL